MGENQPVLISPSGRLESSYIDIGYTRRSPSAEDYRTIIPYLLRRHNGGSAQGGGYEGLPVNRHRRARRDIGRQRRCNQRIYVSQYA
jgi:hypothetical protein